MRRAVHPDTKRPKYENPKDQQLKNAIGKQRFDTHPKDCMPSHCTNQCCKPYKHHHSRNDHPQYTEAHVPVHMTGSTNRTYGYWKEDVRFRDSQSILITCAS